MPTAADAARRPGETRRPFSGLGLDPIPSPSALLALADPPTPRFTCPPGGLHKCEGQSFFWLDLEMAVLG